MTLPFKLTLWRIVAGAIGIFIFIGVIVLSVNWFQARGYDKARKEFEVSEKAWEKEKAEIIGRIRERDKEIAALELEKQAFKTMGEQGVALDQTKAKQIEEISAKEAQDLANTELPTDCGARARDTVARLLTAKPPIKLNLANVIRKQCGPG